MDYTYTILILLLPFLSFLVLGLAGKWLSHRTAGLFGTSVLGIVTAMSYYTAFTYFTADRINDVFPTLVPYNFTWNHAGPHLGHDAHRYLHRFIDGTYLLLRLHAWRTWFPAILCLS